MKEWPFPDHRRFRRYGQRSTPASMLHSPFGPRSFGPSRCRRVPSLAQQPDGSQDMIIGGDDGRGGADVRGNGGAGETGAAVTGGNAFTGGRTSTGGGEI